MLTSASLGRPGLAEDVVGPVAVPGQRRRRVRHRRGTGRRRRDERFHRPAAHLAPARPPGVCGQPQVTPALLLPFGPGLGPGLRLALLTLLGGTLAAGAANAWNMIYDRDIDAVMNRTKNRPLVTGVLSVRRAVVFSAILTVVSVAWFGFLVNWISAAWIVAALLVYVVAYTMILKRRTPQNIVWGGIAGCMPVLIGWSAVTGR